MTTERNAPCPCGSGKKYKRCCGSSEAGPPAYIGLNRAIAYQGAVGRARLAFCEQYTTLKQARLADIAQRLQQDLAARGQQISCARGCAHCCKLFVVASLQECECVVYYLYRHEETLRRFLAAFDGWRDDILKIERCFKKINDLHQKITAGEATAADREDFDEACGLYTRAGIACPFLVGGACSIYEVRPYVCAGVVATTPAEWCEASHPRNSEAVHYRASVRWPQDMPYFARPKSNEIFASMPFLVYDILRRGYAALAAVPGLERLAEQAMSDPEVLAALRNCR